MSSAPVKTWDPLDYAYRRQRIYDEVLNSAKESLNRDYGKVGLRVDKLRYEGPETLTPAQEKAALFKGGFPARRLKGRVRLVDLETNELLDEKDETLMRVPIMTNRGTFIHNGNDYTSAMQARLIPGVYPRRKSNGQLEAHFNVKRATGSSFRLNFDPETTHYKVEMPGGTFRLYPLLKGLGVSDERLGKLWGESVLEANRKGASDVDFDKAYKLMARQDFNPEATPEEKVKVIQEALAKAKVNQEAVSMSLPWYQKAKDSHEIGSAIGNKLLGLR